MTIDLCGRSLLARRGRKEPLRLRPAAADPRVDGRWRHSSAFARFNYGHAGISQSNSSIASRVSSLLNPRRPTTVAGLVVAVRISTIKGHPLGAWSHVGDEVLKDHPALADRDASAAVIRPCWRAGIQASAFHGRPDPMLGRSRAAVSRGLGAAVLSSKAPATDHQPAAQGIQSRRVRLPAIADAAPPTMSLITTLARLRDESPKSLTRNVVRDSHGV